MTIEVKNDEMLGRTNNTTLHIELMKLQQENKQLKEKGIINMQEFQEYHKNNLNDLLNRIVDRDKKEAEEKVNELKGEVVCKGCGSQIKSGSAFCPNCGTKVEVEYFDEEDEIIEEDNFEVVASDDVNDEVEELEEVEEIVE